MTGKKEGARLLISLGLTAIVIAAILFLLDKVMPKPRVTTQEPIIPPSNPSPILMSLGGEIVVKVRTSPDKENGTAAFAKGDFATAVEKFTASLNNSPNDPETLIYLNNAKIAQDTSAALKVAVIAPISFDPNQAEEILRGVAQAQDEVNSSGGINGKKLQILIASSIRSSGNNSSTNSEQLDNELIKDNSLLAVVGSRRNSSIYNDKGLVLVFPIEPARDTGNQENSSQAVNNQSNPAESNYIFYVNSSDVLVDTHSRHIVREARNIAICGDSSRGNNSTNSSNATVSFNKILVDKYTNAINKYGGQVISFPCDLGDKNFQPSAFVNEAIETQKANGFLFIPTNRNIFYATKVAQEIRGRKPFFASETMYKQTTLDNGKDFQGMVLPVYWHRDANKNNPFADKALKLWNAQVNHRTAGAYDALQVIIAGLKQDNTRQGLKNVLSNPNFSASGATGTIKFSPSGERQGKAFLVKVESCDASKPCASGYEFVLLQ
ncbi:MAG: ABC transporter substrate-binding protein [Gloeotrichia echinulata GP01]